MPRKKPASSRAKVADVAADKLLGLGNGMWGNAARFGMAGIVAAFAVYLLTVTLPNAQNSFHEQLEKERALFRDQLDVQHKRADERTKRSYEHGNNVTNKLSDAIDAQTKVIDVHQTLVRKNQESLIRLQEELLKKAIK